MAIGGWRTLVSMAVVAGGGLLLFVSGVGRPAAAPQPGSNRPAPVMGVGCTGRVEPEGGFITVAAAPALGRAPVVARLFVQEEQTVLPGQVIATLDSLPDLESAVRQAASRFAVAQSRLAQLQAGARAGDVLALRSEMARLESESNAARKDSERMEALAAKDFVPRVQVDAARLKVEETERLLDVTRHKLESLTEIRDSDLNLAKSEVAATQADLDRARVQLSAGTIRAPLRAKVIRIVAHPGEAVGPEGVVTLADTSRMSVMAEIYETDIGRVHQGLKATIRSESLPAPLHGQVQWVSPQIARSNLPVEPSAAADQRVYQARIRVDHPELLAGRINSKVTILIEP